MKNVFSKLILVVFAISIVGYLLLLYVVNATYRNYIVSRNEIEMTQLAKNFEGLVREDFEQGRNIFTNIDDELIRFDKYAGLKAWLMLPDGGFLVNTQLFNDNNWNIDLIKQELNLNEIKKMRYSRKNIYRESNFSFLPENKYYTLIYPIFLDENQYFFLFLNKSVPNLNTIISDLNKITSIIVLVAALYIGIMMYFVIKKLNDDIKVLNKCVKFVADGNLGYEFDTDRKDEFGELCNNFNYMTKELKQMEESRKKFISDLSHDLRSPITSIKGYTAGILDGTIPEDKWFKYLGIVYEEAERLTKLINDMLDLSRIESGHLKVEKESFDINALLVDVLDKYEVQILEKNVQIEMKLYKGILNVRADKTLIERLIYNLVDNAVKFVNESGIIECMTNIKGDKVLVGIRNTGTVIEPDKLESIWSRFYKLDNSRGMEKKSSGLGLSIVKEIIEIHHEKIDVYSNEHLGVMFVFSLENDRLGKQI